MRSPLALTVMTWLLRPKPAWASPAVHLVPRQFCDSIVCDPNVDNWFTGIFGGALEWLDNTFQLELPNSSPITGDSKKDVRNPDTPASAQPGDEIFVQDGQHAGSRRCDATAPPAPSPQGTTSEITDLYPCESAKQQTIWPKSCKDVTRNNHAAGLLASMDGQYVTTTDPLCEVKGGIFFWMAWLTTEQIDALNAQQPVSGIHMIVPNVFYDFGKIVGSSRARETSHSGMLKPQPKKRAALDVVRQEFAGKALSFLSTAEENLNAVRYSYLSPAGEGIRAYLIDAGFNSHHPDFHGRPIRWIYAKDIQPGERESEAPESQGAGTCAASLIMGQEYGVAKKTELIMVKAGPTAGSIISAIEEVIRDIYNSVSRRPSNGWVVVQISGGFRAEPSVNYLAIRLSAQINFLIKKWGVVVVTSAGYDMDNYYEDINEWPALLSKDEEHNVIAVGSVLSTVGGQDPFSYGERYPWSRGGNTVTVSAPGDAYCAGPQNGMMEVEASFASISIVTGLVAYFLSVPDVADRFRTHTNTPKALIDFLKLMSYARFEDQESVWNGLDSYDERMNFPDGWTWHPPPSKRPPR